MARLSSLLLLASAPQVYANVAKASLRSANVLGSISRNLSFEPIANYLPQSLVTDNNAIDMDQKYLEQELSKETKTGFENAKAIYRKGGNSKAIARVGLLTALTEDIAEGTEFIGYTASKEEVNLVLFKKGELGSTQLHFRYGISSFQEYYNQCRVGGLQANARVTTGCLGGSDDVIRKDNNIAYRYSYSITTDNYNDRTLQSFSTELEPEALDCLNCPYKDAKLFTEYYGQADYGDEWILAAFSESATTFSRGNANFQDIGYSGLGECIKKGTVYLNVFMHVLQNFEQSLDNCLNNKVDEATYHWDEAVAYYTGSAEKATGASSGYLLHELADKRCKDFKTCGYNGDLESTTAKVNHDFLKLATLGLDEIRGGKCEDARDTKNNIADTMYIPLVQGSLRYAHIMEYTVIEKDLAEGAVFAAAVLPRVHAANPAAATTIYNNMRVGAPSTNFASVKKAFESVYKNMHITCEEVGGIVTSDGYAIGASPCSTSDDNNGNDDGNDDDNDDDGNQSLVLGTTLGSIAGILFLSGIGSIMFIHSRNRDEAPVFEPSTHGQVID